MLQLNIIRAAKIKVRIEGLLRDQEGKAVPYAYTLDCKRLDTDGLTALLATDKTDATQAIAPKLEAIIEGWQGVVDADGKPVAYTPEGMAALLRVPGMAAQVMLAYFDQVQAKAKN